MKKPPVPQNDGVINLPVPELQRNFVVRLIQIQEVYLQEALLLSVKQVATSDINNELAKFADATDISLLASKGLRGELLFATPVILENNPQLIAYYRLLLGYSQKEFYTSVTGASLFKAMESRGTLSEKSKSKLPELCSALNTASSRLLKDIPGASLGRALIESLTLLTLGAQFRGSANVKKGELAIIMVFDAIKEIVKSHIKTATTKKIEILNSAGRLVLIEFAQDPDIIIREQLSEKDGDFRNIIAVEVKGGTDFSNIHNRIGEAEKSHQKAKANGYVECWTVVNVDNFDSVVSKKESPSTNRFYRISQINLGSGVEYEEFQSRVISLTGIPSKS